MLISALHNLAFSPTLLQPLRLFGLWGVAMFCEHRWSWLLLLEYHPEKKLLQHDCSYHLAEKKIPSIHGQTVGYKLEQFIFDAFPYTPSTTLFEVIVFM